MTGEKIRILVTKLKAGEKEAWSGIHEHIGILLSGWARKEKLELDWVASGEGILDSRSVQQAVYLKFREKLLSGVLEPGCFADYKAAVLNEAQEILEEQFRNFYALIEQKDNRAWKSVYERISVYAARWMSGKNIGSEAASDIYQESAMTFFEKVTGSKMFFEASREFKSYYFRILELKAMESNRKTAVHDKRFFESEPGLFAGLVSEEGFEGDDKYFYIEKIMHNTISKQEYYILNRYYFHEDKLSSIAKDLEISDVNCRQKKLQALRKIAAVYNDIASIKNKT